MRTVTSAILAATFMAQPALAQQDVKLESGRIIAAEDIDRAKLLCEEGDAAMCAVVGRVYHQAEGDAVRNWDRAFQYFERGCYRHEDASVCNEYATTTFAHVKANPRQSYLYDSMARAWDKACELGLEETCMLAATTRYQLVRAIEANPAALGDRGGRTVIEDFRKSFAAAGCTPGRPCGDIPADALDNSDSNQILYRSRLRWDDCGMPTTLLELAPGRDNANLHIARLNRANACIEGQWDRQVEELRSLAAQVGAGYTAPAPRSSMDDMTIAIHGPPKPEFECRDGIDCSFFTDRLEAMEKGRSCLLSRRKFYRDQIHIKYRQFLRDPDNAPMAFLAPTCRSGFGA